MVTQQTIARVPSADEIRRLLIAELASVLKVDQSKIDTAMLFDEYGLDSTDAVILVGLVEERLQIELEPELLLRNRSIDEVIRTLQQQGKLASSE
jgi:acyl carrier protein